MAIDPRHEAGKHLSLVEDRHLLYISNIQRHVVPAYAAWFDLCDEFKDTRDPKLKRMVEGVRQFLRYNLQLSVSVQALGREDLRHAIRGLEDDRIHRDAGMLPFMRGVNMEDDEELDEPPKEGGLRGLGNGLRKPRRGQVKEKVKRGLRHG